MVAMLVAARAHAQSYTFEPIAPPGGGSPYDFAINDRGDIVGETIGTGLSTAGFLLSEGRYTTFAVPGARRTIPTGINSAGQIVGSVLGGSGFLFEGGVFRTLPWSAYSINDRGLIAGNVAGPGGHDYGVVYDLAGNIVRVVEWPGAFYTYLSGINNAGQVIGGSLGRSFLYDLATDTFTTISLPGYRSTFVTGINSLGQVVGHALSAIDDSNPVRGTAFVYEGGVYRHFSLPDGTQAYPGGINTAGQIVGRGEYDGAQWFLATPVTVPEPSSAALLAGGAVVIGWAARRRLRAHGARPRS